MKKVALSLLALALVGTSAFAADSTAGTDAVSPVTATLSANGWAQVGTDLDNATWGFKNGTEAKVKLVLVGKGNNSKGDQGGTISVADIVIALAASTDAQATGANLALGVGDVTAKIVAGDLYIKLAKFGSPSVNYSKDIDNDSGAGAVTGNDTYYRFSGAYGATETEFGFASDLGKVDPLASGAGLEIGYTIPSVLGLTFNFDSETSGWAIKNNAEVKAEASLLAVEKLTFKAGFGLSTKDATAKGVGLAAAYDLGVVAPFATFNMKLPATGDATNVIIVGAKAPVVDGVKVAGAVVLDGATTAGKTLTGATASVEVSKVIPIDLAVGAELLDLTAVTRATTLVFAKVSATVAEGISVWSKVSYDTVAAADAALFNKTAVEFKGFMPLTVFKVEYNSNDLMNKASGAKKVGQLFAEAKVSY